LATSNSTPIYTSLTDVTISNSRPDPSSLRSINAVSVLVADQICFHFLALIWLVHLRPNTDLPQIHRHACPLFQFGQLHPEYVSTGAVCCGCRFTLVN
jgi:hypothetical protein